MKKGLSLLLVLLVLFGLYWFVIRKKNSGADDKKPEPIALKKHSESFNAGIDKMINTYLGIKDAFIESDTLKAKQKTRDFIVMLDSIHLDELKNDKDVILESAKASIADIRSNAVSLIAQTNITEMRQDFRMLTEMMYPAFFKTINYEGPKLYLQYCPMAFGEDKGANWISNSTEIINPYQGKNDPGHTDSMLHCGEVKDTIKAQ